jgi:hypothetical protein
MKHALRSQQHHDLYTKYHHQDSEISALPGECGITHLAAFFVKLRSSRLLFLHKNCAPALIFYAGHPSRPVLSGS